jgi:hypothetical protein
MEDLDLSPFYRPAMLAANRGRAAMADGVSGVDHAARLAEARARAEATPLEELPLIEVVDEPRRLNQLRQGLREPAGADIPVKDRDG